MSNEPELKPDLVADIQAKLDRATRIGQKILAPFIYLACVGTGILLGIDGPWALGAIVGLIVGWALVQMSYFAIKWALVLLGIYALGSTF